MPEVYNCWNATVYRRQDNKFFLNVRPSFCYDESEKLKLTVSVVAEDLWEGIKESERIAIERGMRWCDWSISVPDEIQDFRPKDKKNEIL